MLTADLIRASCRKNQVHPRFIDTGREDLQYTARALIEVFERATSTVPGCSQGDLTDALDDLVGSEADVLLFRGLRKLLTDRCEFETHAAVDPEVVRKTVFQLVAEAPMRREPGVSWTEKRVQLIQQAAESLELTAEEVNATLFADLSARQRLSKFKRLEPDQLLDRYNLALAQSVLIRATRLTIGVSESTVGEYRQLFRALKFHQLIHRIIGNDESDGAKSGYTIEIDGPLSLFSNASRYGVAMARFLPTLAMMRKWELSAEVLWTKKKLERTFHLDHKRGLRTHLKRFGQYITSEQETFEDRFSKASKGWEMSRAAQIIRTDRGDVVVPDLQFSKQETGQTGFLEILGFWRAGSLNARLKTLDEPGMENLILAVSRKLAGDRERVALEHPRVVWFSQVLSAKQIRERLDALSKPEA